MARYIDADAFAEKMKRQYCEQCDNYQGIRCKSCSYGDWLDDLYCEPTADVRENVKAHWIDMKPTGDSRFMCSRCKGKEKVPTIMGEPIVWDYCPNCGADMRGEA